MIPFTMDFCFSSEMLNIYVRRRVAEKFEFWQKVSWLVANEPRLCPRLLQLSLNDLVIGRHLLFFQLSFASEER